MAFSALAQKLFNDPSKRQALSQGFQIQYSQPKVGQGNIPSSTIPSNYQYINPQGQLVQSRNELPPVQGASTQNSGDGGGGGAPQKDWSNPANWGFSAEGEYFQTPADYDRWKQNRQNAEEQSQRAIQAALGVFETKKQGLMNRIPGLESARDLRIRGLEEDY